MGYSDNKGGLNRGILGWEWGRYHIVGIELGLLVYCGAVLLSKLSKCGSSLSFAIFFISGLFLVILLTFFFIPNFDHGGI